MGGGDDNGGEGKGEEGDPSFSFFLGLFRRLIITVPPSAVAVVTRLMKGIRPIVTVAWRRRWRFAPGSAAEVIWWFRTERGPIIVIRIQTAIGGDDDNDGALLTETSHRVRVFFR